MVHPKDFVDLLREQGVSFFTGVPDSLLKDLLAYINERVSQENHVTTANEGNAVAVAAGYHLGTGGIAAVYLQNSGLGNAVNPLVSLTSTEVYSIPMLLIIGWRGEPGVHDEPQHMKQGAITEAMLGTLDIPYAIISSDMSEVAVGEAVKEMAQRSKTQSSPAALLIRKGVFEKYPAAKPVPTSASLSREQAIEIITKHIQEDAVMVSTTGKISRELYEVRTRAGQSTKRDFLTVGSMGHASQIALGIALQKKERRVYCIDGDGATIMHMGGLATVGWVKPRNFIHIVLNNLAHESVGGQPSAAEAINLPAIAQNSAYTSARSVSTEKGLVEALAEVQGTDGPHFIEVIVALGSRDDLVRPKESPQENKEGFMEFLGQ